MTIPISDRVAHLTKPPDILALLLSFNLNQLPSQLRLQVRCCIDIQQGWVVGSKLSLKAFVALSLSLITGKEGCAFAEGYEATNHK